MAKQQKQKQPFELFVSLPHIKDLLAEKAYCAYASKSIEDLVTANEDDDNPLDADEIEVAVYHFVGYEKYKKAQYTKVGD